MKADTHLQRFKTLLIESVKITALPALLIISIVAAITALVISSSEPSWEYPTFLDVVYLAVFSAIPFMLTAFLGCVAISVALAFRYRNLPDISAGFLGGVIGLGMAITANLVLSLIFFLPSYIFDNGIPLVVGFGYMVATFFGEMLPVYSPLSLTIIFLSVYVTRRLNRADTPEIAADILDDSKSEVQIELRGAWLGAQVAGIGCVVFIVIQTIYKLIFGEYFEPFDVILEAALFLGFALVLTLPLALFSGYILGSIAKRAQNKVSLTKKRIALFGMLAGIFVVMGTLYIADIIIGGYVLDPLLQGHFILGVVIAMVAGAAGGRLLLSDNYDGRIIRLNVRVKNKKKWLKIILTTTTMILVAYGSALGITYLRLDRPTERELWRNTEYSVYDPPIIVNNLLLFEGYRRDDPDRCYYILAVDKTTGRITWSTEKIEKQYCGDRGAPHRTVISTSETGDVVFVSLSYWDIISYMKPSDDTMNYILYALRSSDGEVLWDIEGYAGYYTLDYSVADTNTIYVVTKEGSFLALDSSTGHQKWEQEIASEVDLSWAEEIFIEYHNQVVYCYYSGNKLLMAFDANTGNPIWEKNMQGYVDWIRFSDKLLYLKTSSYTSEGVSSPYYVTVLDSETGEQVWGLSIEDIRSPITKISGAEIYFLRKESGGWAETAYELGKLDVVDKTTGELRWQFNEDFAHGDIDFIVENNIVYIGTEDGFIFALDNEMGRIIWQTETLGFPSNFILEENTLIVAYEKDFVATFDTKTGAQKWIVDVGMENPWGLDRYLMVDDGVIYVFGALHRKIYAIDIETGEELWSWHHNHPKNGEYYLDATDDNVIFVDQGGDFLGKNWYFALKTEP